MYQHYIRKVALAKTEELHQARLAETLWKDTVAIFLQHSLKLWHKRSQHIIHEGLQGVPLVLIWFLHDCTVVTPGCKVTCSREEADQHQWTVCVCTITTHNGCAVTGVEQSWMKEVWVFYIWAWLSGWLVSLGTQSNKPWEQDLHCGTVSMGTSCHAVCHVRVINECGIHGVWTCLIMRAFRPMFATTHWPEFLIHTSNDFLLDFLIVLH